MIDDHQVPVDPAGFDAATVQHLIRTKHPEVEVTKCDLFDSATTDDPETRVSTAERVTVDVAYGAAKTVLPKRLTIKIARPGLGDIPLYDNEVNIYRQLGDELPALTPQCLGAVRDTSRSSFALLLEDLRVSGAAFPTVLTPVDARGVERLLDQLAALHAKYWQSPRFATDLSWVLPHTSGPIHDLFSHDAGVPMLIAWEVKTQQFKRELVESIDETVESLRQKVAAAQAHQAVLPTTLLHGDCHIGNTYVLPDGRRGLIDWQLAARGYCMHDVSYLLITGLSVRDRRNHEHELIEYYRQRLVEAGVADAPSHEELFHEYRLAAAWNLYIGWLTTPVDNYGWEITVANHIRLATAYRDLNSKSALEALSSSA